MLRDIFWLAVAASQAAGFSVPRLLIPTVATRSSKMHVHMQYDDATRDDSPLAYGEQQQAYAAPPAYPQQAYDHQQQQGYSTPIAYGPQIIVRVVPIYGTTREYTVSNGGQQVLGRYDMGPPTRVKPDGKLKPDPRPYISRMQCVVVCAADGTITLQHVGKNHRPTARLAPNGKWYYLKKGDVHVLTEGEHFSLDSKDPEGAVYTVYVQQGGFPQEQQASQQAQGGYPQRGGYPQAQQAQGGYYNGDNGVTVSNQRSY